LSKHAGQQDADRTRRFDMGERQPAMQRKNGNFHPETDQKSQQQPHLFVARQRRCRLGDGRHGERLGRGEPIDHDDADQNEDRPAHGVQHEIEAGHMPFFAAPQVDQEKQRDQRQFPEHEEQRPVLGHEHAEHGEFQHQQPGVIALYAGLIRSPRPATPRRPAGSPAAPSAATAHRRPAHRTPRWWNSRPPAPPTGSPPCSDRTGRAGSTTGPAPDRHGTGPGRG
jgi:hypothetical protein